MGKRNKTAVEDAGGASEKKDKEVAVGKSKPGFMAGMRWGLAGVGWTARRPLFCSVGLGLLLVAS